MASRKKRNISNRAKNLRTSGLLFMFELYDECKIILNCIND